MSGSSKVLIVEDDLDIANIYSLVLQNDGYIIEVAHNASEALAKVLSFRPDAVLLDIMIPGMDGLHVLDKIRTDPMFTHIQPKIIITTNLAQQDKAEIAKKQGAQGYLVKSNIDPHDLRSILTELLSSSATLDVNMTTPFIADDEVAE